MSLGERMPARREVAPNASESTGAVAYAGSADSGTVPSAFHPRRS